MYPILSESEKNAKKLETKYARLYPIFFDKDKKVSNLLNQKKKMGLLPAMVIIDKKSIIRYVYYGSSMKDIPKNDEIITLLKDINK